MVKQRPRSAKDPSGILQYEVEIESWRFIAYVFFWFFCFFAMFMTRRYVAPLLAAGPETPGSTCGPFADRVRLHSNSSAFF